MFAKGRSEKYSNQTIHSVPFHFSLITFDGTVSYLNPNDPHNRDLVGEPLSHVKASRTNFVLENSGRHHGGGRGGDLPQTPHLEKFVRIHIVHTAYFRQIFLNNIFSEPE